MVKTLIALTTVTMLVPASASAGQRWGRGPMPRLGACFYEHADYRGDYFCAAVGEHIGVMPEEMNDRVSSIRIFGRAEVIVFKDGRFRGGSARFTSSIRDLAGENWNDKISSIRIEDSGGAFGGQAVERERPFERRGEDVDRIVIRAYQDILHRDPDVGGMRMYRSHIIDDRWTEEQVREALRKSPEFRERNTMTRAKAQDIVRRAYLA